jgi:hypothetical protein
MGSKDPNHSRTEIQVKPLYCRVRRSVMRTKRTVLMFALLVGLALLLAACGGGGHGGGY